MAPGSSVGSTVSGVSYAVSTLSRPFNDYSGNVNGEPRGTLTTDALLAACQVSSLDCLWRQSHLGL